MVLLEHLAEALAQPVAEGRCPLPFEGTDGQAEADAYGGPARLRPASAPGHGLVGADEGHGDNRDACLQRQPRRTGPEVSHPAVRGPAPLGEQDEAPTLRDQLAGHASRPQPAAAGDGEGVERDGRGDGAVPGVEEVVGGGADDRLAAPPGRQRREDGGGVEVAGVVEHEDGGRLDRIEDLPPADLGLDLEVQQRGEAEALHDFSGSPPGRRAAPGGREVRCRAPLALHRCREQGPAGPPPPLGDLPEVAVEVVHHEEPAPIHELPQLLGFLGI